MESELGSFLYLKMLASRSLTQCMALFLRYFDVFDDVRDFGILGGLAKCSTQ